MTTHHISHSHTKILRPCPSLRTSAEWSSPIFPSPCTRFHLRPCLPKAKSAPTGPKGSRVYGRIYFVPSRAKRSSVTSAADAPAASTNLKRDSSETKKSLCDWIQLEGVNVLLVSVCGLTSAKAAPYLMALSTTLSVGPSIIGGYPSNNPSSSLSDERIDSACSNIISWLRSGVAVAFAENRKFRAQRCSPTSTTSVLLRQRTAD